MQQRLQERKQQHLYRYRKTISSACGAEVNINNKAYIDFSSNDYLGLANHPLVVETLKKSAQKYGVGSGASHLVSGHSDAHERLENEIATLTGRDRAIVFSSGYMANLGVISAVFGKGDFIFEDKWNHASLLDGGLISGARFQRYLHNDISNLKSHLDKNKLGNHNSTQQTLIVTDGVFSMDGDIAPLKELASTAEKNQAVLMVDDAHGFGVLGENGLGCAELLNLNQQQLPILMATFGKALGTYGAFVAGSNALIESIIQFSRNYIYTTALPPALMDATRCSLRLLQEESERRVQLRYNIQYFRSEAKLLNLPLSDSQTPIQPLLVGSSERVSQLAKKLEEAGVLVGAIRPPTVPKNTARLRITFSAAHKQEHIEALLECLKQQKSFFKKADQ